MAEELNLEEAKAQWKERLMSRIPDVERELYLMQKGPQIPFISDDCPEKYRPLAEKLVALQVESGEYRREDMDSSDMYKVKDISKATGLSFRDVISSLVTNNSYVNYEVIDARHIISLLEEFDTGFEKFYAKYNAFPINVLSPSARRYLKNNNNGLNHEQKLRVLLEVYRPELAGINFEEYNYDALPKSRIVLSEKTIKHIIAELYSIATEDGNIDVIFSEKYETYFKSLCAKLKIAGYTFDRFINEHTKFTYTLCFKADTVKAVRQMVTYYYAMNGSTRGMTTKDPYLRNKVESAQNVTGFFTSRELFESFGIDTDSPDNKNKTLSLSELRERDIILFDNLKQIYPDGIIKKGFASNYSKIYDELCLLYKRLGFASVDEYLASHEFSRIVDKKSTESNIYLSERDLVNYGFVMGCNTLEEIEFNLNILGVEVIGPYENLGIYRKLAFERLDSSYESFIQKTFM